jgi:chromosome segregation ATPase
VAVEGETGSRALKRAIRPLTVAGAAQVGWGASRRGFLLPVELRHANHTAGTNGLDFRSVSVTKPYNDPCMSAAQIEQVAERVERLLVRYEELQRTNALLAEQVEVLTHERDSLKSRLSAARARVDALLERLPEIKKAA